MSIIGFILATAALLGGSMAKGSGIAALLDSAAFLIVIFGTLAAGFVHTPIATMKHALGLFKWVFFPPVVKKELEIEQILEWSKVARRRGLLGLEPEIVKMTDEYLKTALQLLVDGNEPDRLRELLELEMTTREDFDLRAARVYESFGIYAPTLGIMGAVLGLMSVMHNLADPSILGPGISAAFVATIYGIGSANLFFLPIAGKLKAIIRQQTQIREMIIEGMVAIARGDNPRNIETTMKSFL